MSANRADVVVVGAGVIGLSCALQLLQAGRSVTVLDSGAVGQGASHGNCGTITPSHALPLAQPGMISKALRWMTMRDAPFYVKPRFDLQLFAWLAGFARHCTHADVARITSIKAELLNLSRELFAVLIREQGLACEFAASGTLAVYRDARAFDEAESTRAQLDAVGIAMQTKSAAEVLAMEPALREGLVGGHLYPNDACLRPDRYVAELARAVRSAGGNIVEHCPVSAISGEDAGGCRVIAGGQTLPARDVLVAMGAWSPQLRNAVGMRLPVQPGKGYSITYERPALCPRLPLVLKERSVCVTAWSAGYRLGSTMEFSGYDSSLNRARLDALVRGATEYLIEPTGPQRLEEWYGWRPMTYDDLPILGRAPSHPHIWIATGHGMLGVTLSAVTGLLMRQLITGAAPALDPTPFAPQRFL